MRPILFISIILFSFSTYADSYLRGIIGFDSGELNIGFDYESRKNQDYGLGGYFFFSSEGESILNPQVLSFGAQVRLHLFNTNKYEISVAPGFGLAMVEFNDNDETTFGPSLKFSVLYKLSPKMAVGGEMLKIYNWMNDESIGSLDFFNVAVRFKM